MIIHVRYLVICLLVLFFFANCGKGGCNVIPNVTFNTNINRGEHLSVYSPNGFVMASGGVCGLIVYNTGGGRLVAYDRCSTVNPGQKNRVTVEGAIVVDQASGAKWMLSDGSPAAIAECSLRMYNVRKSGDNYYVSN